MLVPDAPIISRPSGDRVDIWALIGLWQGSGKSCGSQKERSRLEERFWLEKAADQTRWLVTGWNADSTIKDPSENCGTLETVGEGTGISLNVALRQNWTHSMPTGRFRYFKNFPVPLKSTEKTDATIFRENTEDIYAGIEWESGTAAVKKSSFPAEGYAKLTESSAVESTISSRAAAADTGGYWLRASQRTESGNSWSEGVIQKFTEGGFSEMGAMD